YDHVDEQNLDEHEDAHHPPEGAREDVVDARAEIRDRAEGGLGVLAGAAGEDEAVQGGGTQACEQATAAPPRPWGRPAPRLAWQGLPTHLGSAVFSTRTRQTSGPRSRYSKRNASSPRVARSV